MLKLIGMALALFAFHSQIQAQGTVSGTVRDNAGSLIAGARVAIMTHGNSGLHGHHLGANYFTQSNSDGTYAINLIDAGSYTVIASKMTAGYAADSITIRDGQNTTADFALSMGRHGEGGMHDDTLRLAHITGKAMIIYEGNRTNYFLDNNDDQQADYRLLFGPDWYDPGSADRPAAGDSIWLTCGLMGYSLPQSVVVYDINGLFWRTPGQGHGGNGGDGNGCPDPADMVLVEVVGRAMGGGSADYYLDENGDQIADYELILGTPLFNPEVARPNSGDTVDIIGGLLENCGGRPIVIVYEFDSQFWRQPGDTTLLLAQSTSIDDPGNMLPKDHLISTVYPNPFNSTALLSFELPREERVSIAIYDVLGRKVAQVVDRTFPEGRNRVIVYASILGINNSGVYFYRIEAGPYRSMGRMAFIK